MFKKLMLMLLCTASLINASETIRIKFFSHSELQKLGFYHDKNGFHIVQDNQVIDIPVYQIDKPIRNINQRQLKAFLDKGYLSISQTDNNEFVVRANVRGLGGGPIAAGIAYCITKSLCYGTAAAAATAAIATTGGAAAAALGAGAATGATATTIGLAGSTATAVVTGGASVGASVVAGAVPVLGLTAAATESTIAVVATAGGFAGAVAAVESASLGVSAFFMALPIP